MTRFSVSSRFTRISVLGSASLLLAFACSSGDGTRDEDDDALGDTINVGQARSRLTRADTCAALLDNIQDNLVAQLEQRARELRENYVGGGRGDGAVDTPGAGGLGGIPGAVDNGGADPAPIPQAPPAISNPNAPTPDSDPAEAPSGGDQAGGPTGGAGAGGSGGSGDFSGTTVQVKDVDEADILKADGDRLFLLHGGTLFVLQAWPAASTEILGSSLLEGTPTEMFVENGRAVVFSSVYAPSGVVPVANDAYYYGSWGYTKITVLDVSGDTPSVLRESYIEGGYVSSRRHDDLVRAVIQDGFKVPSIGYPSIEYSDPFGNRYPQADIDAQVDAWLSRVQRSIRAADLSDFLPREYTRTNGSLVLAEPRCEDYYAPDPGLTQSGVTQVVSFDLSTPSAPFSGATILGNAERVYANEEALLVTQSDYRWQLGVGDSEQTVIHRFEIDGASTTYTASGFIKGTINDQFSLDELDGIIRVSTTENRWNNVGVPVPRPDIGMAGGAAVAPQPVPNGPVNRVVTLRTDGDELVQLGATEDFGLTERIYSTRFIGDKGYVVTFRQTDPFFVIDLADPANPQIVGELKIPGFSNFLFPLGPDHLFAIGQDANEQGMVQGLALQIFDVSDPTNPVLAQPKFVFPEQGASLANVDHRAISFHPSQDLVSFPYESYQTGTSSLEIFRISAADGITRLGEMSPEREPLSLPECLAIMGYSSDPATLAEIDANPEYRTALLNECQRYYYGGPRYRRGVFRDDVVYGISTAGISAYSLDALDGAPLGGVSLPAEVYNQGSGPAYPEAVPPSPPPAQVDPGPATGTGGAASTEDKPVDE
jgi:hypothetical protein